MKPKEIMLKDSLKHIPKEKTPYLCSWYFKDGIGELCFQIKTKDEPHNGIILHRKDVKRLAIFIANFLTEDVWGRGD